MAAPVTTDSGDMALELKSEHGWKPKVFKYTTAAGITAIHKTAIVSLKYNENNEKLVFLLLTPKVCT